MKKHMLFAAAAILGVAGCAKMSKTELYYPDESLKTTSDVTLCLSIEDLSTKVAVDDNGHFLFEENDSVLVLCSDGSYEKFRLDGTGETKRAFFKGNIPSGKSIGEYVIYPCSVAGKCEGNNLTVTLPSNVEYGSAYLCPMVGRIGNDFNVKMHQICSYTNVTVASFPAGISTVSFDDKGGKALSGEYVYDLSTLGKEGIKAKEGAGDVRFVLKTSPSEPTFSIPCAVGDYSGLALSFYDEDSVLIGTQSVSSHPLSMARGSFNRVEMTSEIKVKTKQAVVDGSESFKLKEVTEGVYEAVVDVKAVSSIELNLDSELFGFAAFSGAGGIGDCNSEYSALPFYNFTDAHTKFYHVEKAIGEAQSIADGGHPFWVNLPAPAKVRVVYDSNYGSKGSYYLELVKEDSSVVLDEQFDLFTCGGDLVWILTGTQYGTDPSVYDGITAGTKAKTAWNATGSKNVMWDYPTKVGSTVASDTYMKNRGVEDWTFARVDERPGALQLNQGNNFDSYLITPKLGESGTLKLTLEISRYSSTSHSGIYVDILGGGNFSSGKVDQTEGAGFGAQHFEYASLSGSKFIIGEDYCPCVPSAGNTTVYKPVSTYEFVINGATADTQIKVSAPFETGNPPRCVVFGIKITK